MKLSSLFSLRIQEMFILPWGHDTNWRHGLLVLIPFNFQPFFPWGVPSGSCLEIVKLVWLSLEKLKGLINYYPERSSASMSTISEVLKLMLRLLFLLFSHVDIFDLPLVRLIVFFLVCHGEMMGCVFIFQVYKLKGFLTLTSPFIPLLFTCMER